MNPNGENERTEHLSARINQGGSAGLVDEQARVGAYGTAQAPMGLDVGNAAMGPDLEKPMQNKGLQAWESAIGRDKHRE